MTSCFRLFKRAIFEAFINTGRRNIGNEDNRRAGTPLTTDSFGNDPTIMNSGNPFDDELDDLNDPPKNDSPWPKTGDPEIDEINKSIYYINKMNGTNLPFRKKNGQPRVSPRGFRGQR